MIINFILLKNYWKLKKIRCACLLLFFNQFRIRNTSLHINNRSSLKLFELGRPYNNGLISNLYKHDSKYHSEEMILMRKEEIFNFFNVKIKS